MLFRSFKESNDKEIADLKKKGHVDPLLSEKTDRINDKVSELQDQIKHIQTAMNRSAAADGQSEAGKAHKEAFNKYLRKGVDFDTKALSVDSDPDGGYFVTPAMSAEIVKKVFESSPIRQLASVQTIGTDSLEIMEDLNEASSGWVGESESRSETNTPQIAKIVIPVHELYAMPKASQKFLDDASINVEAWLTEHVAAKFARDEATAFISGNGVNKPKGILSYTSGTTLPTTIEQVVTGSAAAITADGLIDLVYALKEPYKANATFLMNRATVKAVRKLKDGNNLYLWGTGLNGAQGGMLLGFPIMEAADMPTEAASALVAVFGDIRSAYQIVDRVGIRVIRDVYSSKPHVLMYSCKRVGGGIKNFEALKIQKCST